MAVPYTFSTASQSIPLSQLDANFATPVTLGQTTVALGQTVTTITGLTLANVNITSGNVVANASGNVTFGNTTVGLGNSSSNIGNLTLFNTNVSTGIIGPTVTATTQAAGTSNTAVATTAFVNNTALGVSQTWQDVTASRALNTTYTNSTGKPIMVIVGCISSAGGAYDPTIVINSTTLNRFGAAVNAGVYSLASFIVPNGQTYSITATSATLASWSELR